MKILSKAVILLVLISFFSTSLGVCSSEQVNNSDSKKKILFMTLVRNKSTLTILDESQSKKHGILVAPIKEKLQKENFIVIEDPVYFDRMKTSGMDIQSMEKSDILDLFRDGNFDYIYMLEQDPWENRKSSGKLGFQNQAHLKLLSISEGKYLYNGKLYAHTTWGSAFATHRKIAEQIDAIIDEKLLGKTSEAKPDSK